MDIKSIRMHYDILFDSRLVDGRLQELTSHVSAGGDHVAWLRQNMINTTDSMLRNRLEGGPGLFYGCNAVLMAHAVWELRRGGDGLCYLEWADRSTVQVGMHGLMRALTGGAPLEHINLLAQIFYAAARWHAHGKRIFEVTAGLGERMLFTDLTRIGTEDFHLPYRGLYLMVPDIGLRIWNAETGWHRLRGLYLSEDPAYLNPERGPRPRCVRLVCCGEWAEHHSGVPDDAVGYWTLELHEGLSVAESAYKSVREHPETDLRRLGYVERMKDEWDRILPWIINVVLYTTCAEVRRREVPFDAQYPNLQRRLHRMSPKSPKRQKIREELKKRDSRRRIVIGVGIPRLSTEPAARGRTLMASFLRMGFTRMQAYGPRWSLRRPTWISPTWVNRGSGKETRSEHVVK